MLATLMVASDVEVAVPQCPTNPSDRIDCYPPVANFPNVTEEACVAQGCCWQLLNNGGIPCAYTALGRPNDARCAAVPRASRMECHNPRFFNAFKDRATCHDVGCCFDDHEEMCYQPFFEGYELITLDKTESGWRGTLVLRRLARGPFGNDAPLLVLHVVRETTHRVRVRITDPAFFRYEVSDLVTTNDGYGDDNVASKYPNETSCDYKVHFTDRPFGVAVTRRETGELLFNSTPPMEREASFNGLVFENQYLEISTQLEHTTDDDDEDDGPTLYGLGERVAPFQLGADTKGDHYPMFARDQPADTPHTRDGGDNSYGVHPFYLQLEGASGHSHGVFLRSSNAMEVITQRDALTYRTTGGVLDLIVFAGPTPHDVISQYTEVVGRPEMPPYWALGYHLGKWGVESVTESMELVTAMRAQGIPLDALWQDIDYMKDRQSFTLDEQHFPADTLKAFVNDLHFHDQYYVALQTPAISTERRNDHDNTTTEQKQHALISLSNGLDTTDPDRAPANASGLSNPLMLAREMHVFVKGTRGEELAEKYLWSGWSGFIDFFHPNASQYWYEQLTAFHDLVAFDGLWIDMNEPSSTCDFAFANDANACPKHALGRETKQELAEDNDSKDSEVTFESVSTDPTAAGDGGFVRSNDIAFPFDPYRQPFAPGQNTQTRGGHGNLNSATLPMAALHYNSLHYNVHSLYGHATAKTTRHGLNHVLGKRSVLLSRSTYAGSGQYSGHWLGANAATWDNLRLSIAGVLQMNLLGIPLVGPNVCGYKLNATQELCVRWHQAASFFPLMRNHARKDTLGQAPVDFDGDAVNIMRDTLLRRYQYLPYMYTQFYYAHINGTPVTRSLALEFPDDMHARRIEHQYLLGPGLMVSPVVHENAISTRVYFPNATWYNVDTGKLLMDSSHASNDKNKQARTLHLLTPLHQLQVHVRGGYIVPMQHPATTTTRSRHGAFTLVVALDTSQRHPDACGELYVDDGDSLASIEEGRFSMIHFAAVQSTHNRIEFKCFVSTHGYDGPEMHVHLAQIRVYGVGQEFRANSSLRATMTLGTSERDNTTDTEAMRRKQQEQRVRGDYFANAKMLVISDLKIPIGQDFHVRVNAHPASPEGGSGQGGAAPTGGDHDENGDEQVGSKQRGHGKDDGEKEDGQQQQQKRATSSYSVLAIIGTVVGVVFLVGLAIVCVMQRRRAGNSGYEPLA